MESIAHCSATLTSLFSFSSTAKLPASTSLSSLPLAHHRAMSWRDVICASQTLADVSGLKPDEPKENKLWGCRLEESVTDAVERFTESISFDKALYKHDIMGSRAHASMLAKQ
ncbi:Argininosuccinate lyase, partial [Parasponia andersonii]